MKLKIGETMFNFITGFGRIEYNTLSTSPEVRRDYPYMMTGNGGKVYLTREGRAEAADQYPCVLSVEKAALIGYFPEIEADKE